MKQTINKEIFKKEGEELQEFLAFRRRGHKVNAKKGRGSEYSRSKFKAEKEEEQE